jgi:hypothetical protein
LRFCGQVAAVRRIRKVGPVLAKRPRQNGRGSAGGPDMCPMTGVSRIYIWEGLCRRDVKSQ